MIRRLFRLLGLILLGAAAPFAVYFLVALIGALIPRPAADIAGPPEREIVLAAGVIHYDILLPLDEDTREAFAFLGDRLDASEATWLSVGWGSRAFYTTTDVRDNITLGDTWTAITGDDSALRFEVYGPLPEHPKLRRVPLSEAQLTALRDLILADVADPTTPMPLEGFSETDVFYDGVRRFHMFRTCNQWVSRMLASAGLTMGVWTPTPYAVTLGLRTNGHLAQ